MKISKYPKTEVLEDDDVLIISKPQSNVNVTKAITARNLARNIARQVEEDAFDQILESVIQSIQDRLVPIGTVISFMGNTAPENYLICNGGTYNIEDYPLFVEYLTAQFGSVTKFGGNGTTTFGVPDLRGEFLRGTGNRPTNRGTGAAVGTHQDPTWHPYVGFYVYGTDHWYQSAQLASQGASIFPANIDVTNGSGTGKITTQGGGSNPYGSSSVAAQYASRPTNTSVLYCIKAK